MDKIKNIYNRYGQFIRYAIIGGLSAGVDFIVFTLLVKSFAIPYLLANIFSVNVGIILSFVLNRQYNFRVKDRTALRFVSFYTVGLLGLFISSGLLYVMIDLLSLNKVISKLISIFVIVIVQFSLNKYFTFKVRE